MMSPRPEQEMEQIHLYPPEGVALLLGRRGVIGDGLVCPEQMAGQGPENTHENVSIRSVGLVEEKIYHVTPRVRPLGRRGSFLGLRRLA